MSIHEISLVEQASRRGSRKEWHVRKMRLPGRGKMGWHVEG
jgi:hypothetical protein